MNIHAKLMDVFDRTFAEGCGLSLGFEDAEAYNARFRHTFARTVREAAGFGEGLKILEIGSFTGVVSVALARLGHDVTASDVAFVVNDPAIVSWFDAEGIKRISVDLTKDQIPSADCSIDVIVFHSVLAHLNVNPIPVLREFARVLRSGGRVYCETPNLLAANNTARMIMRRGFLSPVEYLIWNLNPGKRLSVGLIWREYTRDELVGIFSAAGFELERHRYVLRTPNRSAFPRRQLVALMYRVMPSLMPSHEAVFRKL